MLQVNYEYGRQIQANESAEPNSSISKELSGDYYEYFNGTANVSVPVVYSSSIIEVSKKWHTVL